MRLRTLLKPLSFIPAILLIYLIFQFSAQEADESSALSYKVSRKIVATADYLFDVGLDEARIDHYAHRINGITRKVAHMTEYFLLAVAMSFPLYVYGLRGILLLIIAGSLCVLCAGADEYHQSLVAGRAASLKDVGIDSLGILVGIILVRIIGWTGRHTLFAPAPPERYERMTRKELRRYRKMQQEAARTRQPSGPYRDQPYDLPDDPRYGQQYDPRYAQPYDTRNDPRCGRQYDPRFDPRYDARYDPRYDPRFEEPEQPSSDELSDDVPLSRLLKPK